MAIYIMHTGSNIHKGGFQMYFGQVNINAIILKVKRLCSKNLSLNFDHYFKPISLPPIISLSKMETILTESTFV